MTSYRSYQQVLNIAIQPKVGKSSISKKSSSSMAVGSKKEIMTNNSNNDNSSNSNSNSSVKRRTKTGCLTCRKRKKKCDEDKVNGKCQGCTRNFLECCWPEVNSPSPKITTVTTKIIEKCTPIIIKTISPTLPVLKSTKCSISSLLIQEVDVKPEIKSEPQTANPYPSPSQSPLSDAKQEINDISFISLPPLLNVPPYKVHNNDSNVRGSIKVEQEVSPSSPVTSTRSSIVEANSSAPANTAAKFIITSIDEHKDLCQVPN